MPASAEDLKARAKRAQRRARRERARQRALLGPGWGLPASVEASLDRKKLLDALTRDGGPMPGARTSDQSRRAIRAASEVAKAEAIKARARKEKRDLTPEETRHVADLNRGALEIANAGPGNPGENALTLFVGPSVASWLPGGIPRQGGAGSLALEAALFALPTRGVGGILGRGARAAGIPTRTLAARGFEHTVVAAASRPGRIAETVANLARSEGSKLKAIGRAQQERAGVYTAVATSSGKAAQRRGRHLPADQAKAVQLLNDEAPLAVQRAAHERWLREALEAGRRDSATAHRIHIELIDDAARYLDDTTGVPVLRADAPRRLRTVWDQVQKAGDARSEIIRDLGLVSDEAMAARLSKPGRLAYGAEWYSKAAAAADTEATGAMYREMMEEAAAAARQDVRAWKQAAKAAGGREAQAAAKAERIAATPARRLEDAANAAASRAMDARSATRGRALRAQATVERLSARLEDALTNPAATPADITRRIQAVTAATKRLRGEQVKLRRLVREGSDIAAQQAFLERVSLDEGKQLFGRIRAAVVQIHAAHGAKSAYGQAATRAANAAERELARLKAAEQAVIDTIQSKAGTLIGAEHFTGGRTFIPDVRGVPGVQPHTLRSVARQAHATIQAGFNRRAFSQLPNDPSVKHEWQGILRKSGLFRTDVHNLAGDALARAVKLHSVVEWRRWLLSHAADAAAAADDIPIAVKPGSKVPPELKEFWDTWGMLEAGDLSAQQVKALGDNKTLEGLLRAMFPEHLRNPVPGTRIDGVRWVPRALLHDADALASVGGRRGYPTKFSVFGREIEGMTPFDIANDYIKASILFGNPAYPYVQAIQNIVLGTIHQGVFLPRNWTRSARFLAKMKPENREALLTLMEAGHASVLQPAKAPINFAAKYAMFVADRYPRMASFAHEANRAGIRTVAEADALIDAVRAGNSAALEKLTLIRRAAINAIGDFERLGPFEKNIAARLLFVYPWLKAAGHLTYRMAVDHPWQGAAIGYGALKAKEYADEQLGDRPPWAMFEIPIPGMVDENGNPVTVNILNLVPWGTPYQVFEAGRATATGGWEEGTQALDLAQPGIRAGITALTGRNEYGQEVGRGVPTFAREVWKITPWARTTKGITATEEERREKMFPRDTQDELIRLGLGSLAPKPYNIEKAQAIAHGKTRTAGSYVRQAMRELEKFIRDNPDTINTSYYPLDAFQKALEIRARVADKQSEMRRNQKAKKLTERQEYAAKLSVLQELRPELGIDTQTWQVFRQWFETASSDELDTYKTKINALLELEDVYGQRLLSALERTRSKVRDREREQKLGITGG